MSLLLRNGPASTLFVEGLGTRGCSVAIVQRLELLMRILLVRHGEVDNPDGLRYGCLPGFSLSARGREQIAATSRELLRRGLEGRCVLVSSPLDRAAESADIVAEALHPQARATDERLRERGSVRDGLARVPSMKALALRLCEPGAVARHERRAFVADRMKQAVSSVLDLARRSGCDTAVVVSHQAPIGILRAALEHGGAESSKPLRTRLPRLWLPWPLLARPSALGSISELELAEERSVFRGYWSPSSAG